VAGQLGAFGEGIDHEQADGRFNPMSPGLQGMSDSWTNQILNEAARPRSLLQPMYANQLGVGMDARTAAERFPDGQLPANFSGNGQSEESVMPSAMLRMTSGDNEAD
jgi:hypothetical protein